MSRFNLVTEPWICIIEIETGQQRLVSMAEAFRHADKYRCLAGDTETQDFAVLRVLVAVLQTVYSRYDASGVPYDAVTVNNQMQQISDLDPNEDEEAFDEYLDQLDGTWDQLWKQKQFTSIVLDYLNCWNDHFYLFDDRFPFFQTTKSTLEKVLPKGKKASPVAGKFLNRTISESNNKVALFAPKADSQKDHLDEAELARWIITYQGYTGLSDKASLVKEGQKPSKGWLFDIGGLYLEGNNLFETLMLNYIPYHLAEQYRGKRQRPCWEYSDQDVIDRLVSGTPVNNFAELYTNWSRIVYMDPKTDMDQPVNVGDAKLPLIAHDVQLEPMTIWHFNKSGDFKGHFTPCKYTPEQAMWRSFGLITLKTSTDTDKEQYRPGILEQYSRVKQVAGNRWFTLHAVGMRDDGNATSWLPIDELTDSLNLNDIVISDTNSNGWVVRVNEVVDVTKKVVDSVYWSFLKRITEIRDMDESAGNQYIYREKELLYQRLDKQFRNWLEELNPDDSIETKAREWRKQCKTIVVSRAKDLVSQSGGRDFTGIEKGDNIENVPTAYLTFLRMLNQTIGEVN